jgi:Retrotransposon gag protein.
MPSDSEETAAGLEITDPRVGWIYKLNKEALTAELKRFNLETGGTVEEMRRRITRFLRNGAPVARSAPSEPTISIPEVPRISAFELLNQIRKLNIVFDGKTDPISFLERLEQVQSEYEITDAQLLKTLPGVLQGKAYQWYMNYKHNWSTCDDFVQDFKTFFYPSDYRDNLEEMISSKYQAKQETARNFILEMQTMIRRHGGFSAEREVTCIYKRLRAEYRQYIRRTQVETISDLVQQTYEYEQLQKDLDKENKTRKVTEPVRNAGIADSQPNRTIRPNSRPNYETNNRSQTIPRQDANTICWRCGATGHTRFTCRGPFRLFCSRCGREGVQTRHCRCVNQSHATPGNAVGAGTPRGQPSARQSRPPNH